MTIIWFLFWVVCSLIGSPEAISFDPVNGWGATLLFAAAIDLSFGE